MLQDSKTTEKARTAKQRYRTMQATHFRIAVGVEAGLTNSAVRPLSVDPSGSKPLVSFATVECPFVADEAGALRFPVGRFVASRAVWKGFLIIFFFMLLTLTYRRYKKCESECVANEKIMQHNSLLGDREPEQAAQEGAKMAAKIYSSQAFQ